MRLRHYKQDREGVGKMAMIAIIAVIAVVIGAFVIYPAFGKTSETEQMMGIAITDVQTGKTVTGEINIAPMSMMEMMSSLGSHRTVTLPAMYTAEEMASYNTNVPGVVLARAYVITPFVSMNVKCDDPSLYSTTGSITASFTGKSYTGLTTGSAGFDMLSAAKLKAITSTKDGIMINAGPYLVNGPTSASAVKFTLLSDGVGIIGTGGPLKGAYLDNSVISAALSAKFTNTQTNAINTQTNSADLTIHLISPLNGIFSIEVTNMGMSGLP